MPGVRQKLPLYVLKEVVPWYLGGVLLFLTLQMTDVLSSTVGRLITYRVPLAQVLALLGDQMPALLNRCLVLAVPFALLLAFGRLAKDSEFKAAMAGGVRPLRLLLPLLVPALLVGGFAYYNAGWVTPAGQERWWNAWYGVFNQAPPPPSTDRYAFAQGDTFYSAGRVQNDRNGVLASLVGVLVIRGDTVYSAANGVWDALAHTWTMGGVTVVGPDGVPRPYAGELTLPQRDVLQRPVSRPDQTGTPQLRAQLRQLQAERPLPDETQRSLAFELSRRVADPFTPLAFVLAAGALGLLVSNRAWAAGSVILFIFGFYVLWSTVPSLAQAGALSPTLAAWLPNLVFVALGAALAWRLR
ncbi:LptF/LptG family permease [Deinococcus aquiradiocola]|uniref:Permease n=1 Tax=Deinococcus aquiradiocola TaxID=393059 RepID=A0A917UT70_9DEIO|nr:LptF/LptG family permease [Deinococcus aquiradiocola]GGJ83359.1 permease [Deinococcus aquiradiocola]